MKKNKLFLGIGFLALVLSGCGGGTEPINPPSDDSGGGVSKHVHVPGTPVRENEVEPNCTTDGSYDLVTYCTVDGQEVSREHKTVPALSHNYEISGVVPASFDGPGLITYTCSRCGDWYTEEGDPQLEHTYYDAWLVDEEHGTHYQLCKDEGFESLKGNEAPHTFDSWIIDKDASFDESGSRHRLCHVCGHREDETIPQLIHSYSSEWSVDEEQGTHYHACTDEGFEDLRANEAPHIFGNWVIDKPADYDGDGLKHRSCNTCGHEEQEVIPQLIHKYSSIWSVDEEEGTHYHACTDEGFEDLRANEAPHLFGGWIVDKPASYTESGLKHHVCTICQHEEQETIPQLVHSYSSEWSVDEEHGTHYHACIDEGFEELRGNEGEHTFGAWEVTKEPSGIHEGEKTRTCSECGYQEKQIIGATGTLNKLAFVDNGDFYGVKAKSTTIAGTVIVPSEYNNKPVKRVETQGFTQCKLITKVVLPNSITTLNQRAFSSCSKLESIILPNGLTTIGPNCFGADVALTELHVPDTVTSIDSQAFYNCQGLKNITLSNSLTTLNSSTFYGCKELTNVTIPSGVTSIGASCFEGCSNLLSINLPSGITKINDKTFYNCSSLISITIPSGVTSIGSDAFYNDYCLVEVVNKSSMDLRVNYSNNGYVSYYAKQVINNEADSKLSTSDDGLVLYHGEDVIAVKYIGEAKEVNVPEEVTIVGRNAFYNNNSITSVILPTTLKTINNYAFYNCQNLKTINFPEGLVSIGEYAFDDCLSLTTLIFPNSLTSIGNYAFSGCLSLYSVTIGTGLTTVNSASFFNCYALVEVINHSSLSLKVGNTGNGYLAYYAKQVIKDEANSKLSIRNDEFITYTGGNEVILVKYIGHSKNVVIPDDYTSIVSGAFYGASNMESLTTPFIGQSASATGKNGLLGFIFGEKEYPGSTKVSQSYGTASYNKVDLYIPSSLNTVTITGSVIPARAFYNCNMIKRVNLSDKFTSIGELAFYYCLGLESINIPSGVTSIGVSAFSYCSSLQSVTLPEGLTSIGSNAFGDCKSLKSIIIPDTVNSLGSSAFYFCSSLQSVTLPEGITTIGDNTFRACSNLGEVVIPNSVTSIGEYAFSSCDGLYSVTIGSGVTSIGTDAFASDFSLAEVVNKSSLSISTGSTWDGQVGYYAKQIITDEANSKLSVIDNKFVIYTDGDNVMLVKYIGEGAFVSIPEGVTTISQSAFVKRYDIKSIVIPSTLTTIESTAFRYTEGIFQVINKSSLNIEKNSFDYSSVARYAQVVVNDEADSALITVGDLIVYINGSSSVVVGYIGDANDVVVPASITQFRSYAFYGCKGAESLTFNGTMEDWYEITLDSEWKEGHTISVVHCLDGDITL